MPAEPSTREKTRQLARLLKSTNTQTPDKKDLDALKQFLDENPDTWGEVGGLANTVTLSLIDKMSSDSAGVRELRRKECSGLSEDLGYSDAPAIERMLIEQVVMCWMRLWWTEFYATAYMMGENYSMKVADHWDKKLSHAQKRYTHAVESLARVRKITRATKTQTVAPKSDNLQRQIAGGAIRGLNNARRAG